MVYGRDDEGSSQTHHSHTHSYTHTHTHTHTHTQSHTITQLHYKENNKTERTCTQPQLCEMELVRERECVCVCVCACVCQFVVWNLVEVMIVHDPFNTNDLTWKKSRWNRWNHCGLHSKPKSSWNSETRRAKKKNKQIKETIRKRSCILRRSISTDMYRTKKCVYMTQEAKRKYLCVSSVGQLEQD